MRGVSVVFECGVMTSVKWRIAEGRGRGLEAIIMEEGVVLLDAQVIFGVDVVFVFYATSKHELGAVAGGFELRRVVGAWKVGVGCSNEGGASAVDAKLGRNVIRVKVVASGDSVEEVTDATPEDEG